MGIYTTYKEDWIDEKINSKLNLIVKMILKNVKGVVSVILTGGFGRGEGSVRLEKNEITLLKDFDIVVIVDPVPTEDIQKNLLDTIYQELGLKNAERELFRFSQFVVDIRYLKEKDLAYPDIWFYDLKMASKVLYGKNIANLIPYNANDIPFSSGFRILFEKATGLLAHFSYDYIKGSGIEINKHNSLVYECLKAYIEMGTALCILTKHYKPSYQDRMKIIKEIYKKDLSELSQEFPELPELIEMATNFKLNPDTHFSQKDPVDLWFSTRNHLGSVTRYYLKKTTRLHISDWNDLQQLKKYLTKTYYKPLLKSWIKQRFGISGDFTVKPLNYFYHIFTNIKYIYQIKRNQNMFYLRPMTRPISPSLKFYLASPLILFSLDRSGNIRHDYIDLAINELRYCIPVDINNGINIWENAKNHYLTAYKLYNGPHFIK